VVHLVVLAICSYYSCASVQLDTTGWTTKSSSVSQHSINTEINTVANCKCKRKADYIFVAHPALPIWLFSNVKVNPYEKDTRITEQKNKSMFCEPN
jgi:hypothetical protein